MFWFDEKFLEQLLKKDSKYFNEFYLKTIDIFYRYLKSNYYISDADAQDIISDFYLKVWNGLSSYKIFYSFEAWIRTIFKNLLKDYFKKSKELNFSQLSKEEESAFEDTLCSDDDILKFLESKSQFENIQAVIWKLDETSKEIIFLKFVEEKTNKEISKMLKINEEVIRQRLSRAIKKIKSRTSS